MRIHEYTNAYTNRLALSLCTTQGDKAIANAAQGPTLQSCTIVHEGSGRGVKGRGVEKAAEDNRQDDISDDIRNVILAVGWVDALVTSEKIRSGFGSEQNQCTCCGWDGLGVWGLRFGCEGSGAELTVEMKPASSKHDSNDACQ
jgi:hypothetical protein